MFPLAVGFPVSIRFHNRQSIFAAQFIGNSSDPLVVSSKIIAEHPPIHKRNRVYDNMVVQMSFVQMGTDGTLKTVSQKPPGEFAADFVYLIGCCLTGLEALNNMVAHIAAVQRFAPTPLCCLHKIIGVLRVAVKAGNIELVLGFIAVLRVVHQPLHICGVQILRLLRIGGVIQAAFQLPAHRQNFCDCHY